MDKKKPGSGDHAHHHGSSGAGALDTLSVEERKMIKDELGAAVLKPDRHAFIMVGEKTLFLCHMPMFHMEGHCYQLILRVSLPEMAMQRYRAWRKQNPKQAYFLANLESDLMSVPAIQAGERRSFRALVHKGIPREPVGGYTTWPWGKKDEGAVIGDVLVTVEHVVHARHFDFNADYPRDLTYILFGADDEAHMQSHLTKEPDFDHVLSLREAPAWLPKVKLAASVHVNFPGLPNRPARSTNPLVKSTYKVQYYGFEKYLDYAFAKPVEIEIGQTWWFGTTPLNMRPPAKAVGRKRTAGAGKHDHGGAYG